MKRLEDMTEPELRELCTAAARAVEGQFAMLGMKRPLFCLLIFDDPKVAQYVSNCDRGSMVEALREAADRLEGREDVGR